MNLHKIAGLYVDLGYKYEYMTERAPAYKTDDECKRPHMTIHLPDELLEEKMKETEGMDMNLAEYLYTGAAFYTGLLQYGGFLLHSSAIVMDGKAYLFTADSGTGKSTHTELWRKAFGEDRVQILNDDKPAIRIAKEGYFACGTPWSGKHNLSMDRIVPIAAIGFLERSEENWIERRPGGEMVGKLLKQTVRPPVKEEMEALLTYVDMVLSNVPVYALGVNMSLDAAIMAHEAMSKGV